MVMKLPRKKKTSKKKNKKKKKGLPSQNAVGEGLQPQWQRMQSFKQKARVT